MKHKLTLLGVLLTLISVNTGFGQDAPPINNFVKFMKWYTDRGLTPPMSKPVEPGPFSYVRNNTPPNPLFTDGPDIRVFPSGNAQSENSIGVNVTTPTQLMISTNGRIPGSNPVVHQTWFFSTDAGLSWFGSESLPSTINDSYGDPVAFFDVSGRAYFSTIHAPGGLQITSTTNFGVTWSTAGNMDALSSTGDDKQHTMSDLSGTNPNNIYNAWTDFNVGTAPVQFSRSTDKGVTWSARQTLAIGSFRGQGTNIACGPNGEVYVTWGHYGGGNAETGVGFARSVNGGASFTVPAVAFPISGIRVTNGGDARFNNVRVNSFPHVDVDRSNGPRRGTIYVVDADQSTGDADIKLWKSTDLGATWSAPITVNSDVAGSHQWFPSVAVDQVNGNVYVSYYNFVTTSGFQARRWLANSLDGGVTWDRGQVSDVAWTYAPQGTPNTNPNYNGDYYETAGNNNKVWPCWTDNRSGANNAYVSIITTTPPLVNDIACGPFMNLPSQFQINTAYNIKTRVQNVGTAAQTNIPVKFFINGTLTNTTNIAALAPGQIDSVNNVWTPTVVGSYTLTYASALATDQNRNNDTVRTTVQVQTSIPQLPAFECCQLTWAPITGTPGPSGDDVTLTVSSPFTIYYVGTNYTQVSICTNGFVVMGASTDATYINDLCLTTAVPKLCPFWDDLNTAAGGNIQYTTLGTTPNRVFVIQWLNVGYFSGTGNVTFQVRISEAPASTPNRIQFIYGPAVTNGAASGSIGLTDQTGGSSHIISVTPGATCGSTTFSTSTCNNSIAYNTANLASGVNYFGCLTGISSNGNIIPNSYFLAQNYPNPFNPTTQILYGLPKTGLVKLVVFDLIGREVRTLVNENKQAGTYDVTFDASALASGVYFYQITSGDFTDVKKLMIIK